MPPILVDAYDSQGCVEIDDSLVNFTLFEDSLSEPIVPLTFECIQVFMHVQETSATQGYQVMRNCSLPCSLYERYGYRGLT